MTQDRSSSNRRSNSMEEKQRDIPARDREEVESERERREERRQAQNKDSYPEFDYLEEDE